MSYSQHISPVSSGFLFIAVSIITTPTATAGPPGAAR